MRIFCLWGDRLENHGNITKPMKELGYCKWIEVNALFNGFPGSNKFSALFERRQENLGWCWPEDWARKEFNALQVARPSCSLPYLLWFFPKWAREAASWQGPHLELFIVLLFVDILGDVRTGSQFCLHSKLVVGETWDSLWPGLGSCFTPVDIEWCWSLRTFPRGTYWIVISSKVGHASPGASLLLRNVKAGATGSWGHGKNKVSESL